MQRPYISPLGKVVFVGAAFPPSVGGSVVVMRELLRQYDSDSYNIVSLKSMGVSGDVGLESRMLRIGTCKIRPYRLALWVRFLQMPFVLRKACRFTRDCGSKVIVCIYPTIDFLFLGYMMAKKTGLPLIVYMHDTLVEAHQRTSFSWVARRLHNALKKQVARVFVMSDGMRLFYQNKYEIESIALPHIYSESIREFNDSPVTRLLFWGGAIYGINDRALQRVLLAAKGIGMKLIVTCRDKEQVMRQLHEPIESDSIDVRYYKERLDYLSALPSLGIMVLALNRPEETEFGEGEISTIFPTKTPEYLASGAPILVHCPKHYYLAEFFRNNKCGIVVDECGTDSIRDAIMKLASNDDSVKEMRRNAIKAASLFSPGHVCATFSETVSDVMKGV